MSITKDFYGKLPDGREVYRYTLVNKNGMKIRVLNYGGTVTELWTPDRKGGFTDLIGGYDSLDSYLNADGYQGALIGRWANRITAGKFTLDGKDYQLYVSPGTGNHCHGGLVGFDKKIFDVEAIDAEEPVLKLHLVSPDGEEGFPGTLDLTVTYTLTNENGWRIHYFATTDKATIINLTHHAYLNLGGYASGSVHPTILQLDADTYLPTDENLVPTGEIRSVEGTPFDFRKAKAIGRDINEDNTDLRIAGGVRGGYDHCFNFAGGGKSGAPAVKRGEAYDEKSGRVLELYTNSPCVQLYTGNFISNPDFPYKGGYTQTPQILFCLETQFMPDSINKKGFTECVLRPGEVYDYTTEYRFSVK